MSRYAAKRATKRFLRFLAGLMVMGLFCLVVGGVEILFGTVAEIVLLLVLLLSLVWIALYSEERMWEK